MANKILFVAEDLYKESLEKEYDAVITTPYPTIFLSDVEIYTDSEITFVGCEPAVYDSITYCTQNKSTKELIVNYNKSIVFNHTIDDYYGYLLISRSATKFNNKLIIIKDKKYIISNTFISFKNAEKRKITPIGLKLERELLRSIHTYCKIRSILTTYHPENGYVDEERYVYTYEHTVRLYSKYKGLRKPSRFIYVIDRFTDNCKSASVRSTNEKGDIKYAPILIKGMRSVTYNYLQSKVIINYLITDQGNIILSKNKVSNYEMLHNFIEDNATLITNQLILGWNNKVYYDTTTYYDYKIVAEVDAIIKNASNLIEQTLGYDISQCSIKRFKNILKIKYLFIEGEVYSPYKLNNIYKLLNLLKNEFNEKDDNLVIKCEILSSGINYLNDEAFEDDEKESSIIHSLDTNELDFDLDNDIFNYVKETLIKCFDGEFVKLPILFVINYIDYIRKVMEEYNAIALVVLVDCKL